MPDDSFGPWMKQRRRARDLTQAQLAHRAGCAVVTLRKIEAGALRPSRELGARLVALLADTADEARAAQQAARRAPHAAPGQAPAALAAPPTALVGREDDVAALCALVRGGARLVTLTGPGGVGKTRLALAVAQCVADDFPDSTWSVGLAPLRDPGHVGDTILAALGIAREQGVAPAAQIGHYLRDRHALLVLDNFEHVAAAAPLVAEVVAGAPDLTVLATSRAPLRLSGEREVPVRPLAAPAPGDALSPAALAGTAAVTLFLERARAVRPDLALTPVNAAAVAAICARLDGLPLALELAAARTKLLEPEQLLERLARHGALATLGEAPRDRPARQRTLRDTLVWSYALLEPGEQAALRGLSVFTGPWELDAAEAVCADAATLGALMDKGLVSARSEEGRARRFWLLETVREFAHELLEASGEAGGVRRRHAEHYLALVEAHERDLGWSARQGQALARMEADIHHIRAALAWAVGTPGAAGEASPAALGLRLNGALWQYWLWRGSLAEGVQWFERLLQRAAEAPPEPRARALSGLGALLMFVDAPRAVACCKEAISLYRSVGDVLGAARARHHLGRSLVTVGALGEGIAVLQKARAAFAEHRAAEDLTWVLLVLGDCARLQHEAAQAERLVRAALALSLQTGDVMGRGYALFNLGRVAHMRGQRRRALTLLEEGVAVLESIGAPAATRGLNESLATVLYEQGEFDRAAAILRDTLRYWWDVGSKIHLPALIDGLAAIAAAGGMAERAARLYGGAAHMRATSGPPLRGSERSAHADETERCRALLPAEDFEIAWESGASMPPDALVAYALEGTTPPR